MARAVAARLDGARAAHQLAGGTHESLSTFAYPGVTIAGAHVGALGRRMCHVCCSWVVGPRGAVRATTHRTVCTHVGRLACARVIERAHPILGASVGACRSSWHYLSEEYKQQPHL